MTEPSKTPRTDAVNIRASDAFDVEGPSHALVIVLDHARQLERELSAQIAGHQHTAKECAEASRALSEGKADRNAAAYADMVVKASDAMERASELRTEVEDLETDLRALRSYAEALRADARKVLEGFDEGVFIREIAHDAKSDWAVTLLPYMAALGRLQANVTTPPPGVSNDDVPQVFCDKERDVVFAVPNGKRGLNDPRD